MPSHIETLFAGRSLPLLDGDEHRERKRFVMAGFTREALAAYLPVMQRLVGEALSDAAAKGDVRLLDACKRLSIETICLTVLGLTRGPVLEAVLEDYDLVLAGFASLPVPLPGTTFTRSKQALSRILAVLESCVRERQNAPQDDGVSRILAARGSDGRPIGVAEAVRELHHVVVAGFIVWAWLLTGVLKLSERPEELERLRAEIRASGAGTGLSLETLERMHGLQRTSMALSSSMSPCTTTPMPFTAAASRAWPLLVANEPRTGTGSVCPSWVKRHSWSLPQDMKPRQLWLARSDGCCGVPWRARYCGLA